ncbi:MAG: hypothetical protein ACJ8AX_08895 [Gemmatimonadales bacterium]
MQQLRPTPFDLVFENAAQTSFPAIRTALSESIRDPRDRDGFLMLREVVSLLRELRPDEGLGEGIDQLAALVHHGYLFWAGGGHTLRLSSDQLSDILGHASLSDPQLDGPALYTQLPERRVWAQVIPGEPHEPLDGWFQYHDPKAGLLRVLGVFGIHPDRPGFSVVEVSGRRPVALARPDGSSVFSSTLPGGAAAGLSSLAGEEELLELGWRIVELGVGNLEAAANSAEYQAPSSELSAPDSQLSAPSS